MQTLPCTINNLLGFAVLVHLTSPFGSINLTLAPGQQFTINLFLGPKGVVIFDLSSQTQPPIFNGTMHIPPAMTSNPANPNWNLDGSGLNPNLIQGA